MLTKAERRSILRFFAHCSNLCLIPLDVSLTGKLHLTEKKWRRRISFTQFGLFALNSAYKNVLFLYVFLFERTTTPLHHLMLLMVMAIASSMIAVWYTMQYLIYPDVHVLLANMALNGDGDADVDESWWVRFRKHSLQDLMALYLPPMVCVAVISITVVMIYDPNIKGLLYHSIPHNYKNVITLAVLVAEETRFCMFGAIGSVPLWQMQILSFDKLIKGLNEVAKNKPAQANMKAFRNLQLHVSLFNALNRYLIFSYKLLSLIVSITNGYTAIAHFGQHPIFGVMYYVLASENTGIYTLIYDKAFEVPDRFQVAKRELLHKLGIKIGLSGWKEQMIGKQLKSIPSLGIQVGEFHTLDRSSTPIFVNYILQNVCAMLLSFR